MGILFTGWQAKATDTTSPVVLELYTSQSCSSCPPADRLLQELAQSDPSVIPLSFHVDYWDYLQWKDPFSSPDNTERQRRYGDTFGRNNVYTPQLIVDGRKEMVGSHEAAVRSAVASAKSTPKPVAVTITPQAKTYQVTISAKKSAQIAKADIWLARIVKYAKTSVPRGENAGATIENVNNVVEMVRLKSWTADAPLTIPVTQGEEDGIAILVQTEHQSSILGAALAMRRQ